MSLSFKKGLPDPLDKKHKSGIIILWPWSSYPITPLLIRKKHIFFIESSATSYCPTCREPLSYRDTCKRTVLLEERERRTYLIRRLKCPRCGQLHRELPDCLAPYKHYASNIISGTLDGLITPEDSDSEDYPNEATIHRWHHWLMANYLWIENYLNAAGYDLPEFGKEPPNPGVPLLEKLRSSNERWLETILCFIYNSGGFLISA